ncbi:MAG: hypothetical protein HYX91_05365 [Chloroflexi bacterium]|nr:hypothetical protein [Chloroflexota bacterium]
MGIWRGIWHLMGGLFFPVLAFLVSRETLLIALGGVAAFFLLAETARFASTDLNRWLTSHVHFMLKSEEVSKPTGSTYMLLASLLAFLVFQKEVAIAALVFLAIGDFAAARIGRRFGRHKVLNKSWEGSGACLTACLAIALLMTLTGLGLPVALLGAVSATLIELAPIPLNDNLTMPLFSGALMTAAGLYL